MYPTRLANASSLNQMGIEIQVVQACISALRRDCIARQGFLINNGDIITGL